MNKRSNKIEWYHREGQDDWVVFFTNEVRLHCENRPDSRHPYRTFQVFNPFSPETHDPTLVCYDSGECSVCIQWVRAPTIQHVKEVYGLDREGEAIAQDPLFGRRCVDQIITWGLYIRMAENIPSSLKDPLVVALSQLEASLTKEE